MDSYLSHISLQKCLSSYWTLLLHLVSPIYLQIHRWPTLSVLGLDEIRHRLRLALVVVGAVATVVNVVAMAMAMAVVLGTDVFHLVSATTLWTALDRPVAGAGEPDDVVRVGGAARAADILLVAEAADYNWVFQCAWRGTVSLQEFSLPGASYSWLYEERDVVVRTHTAGIQRPHVKDVYALHLAEDF